MTAPEETQPAGQQAAPTALVMGHTRTLTGIATSLPSGSGRSKGSPISSGAWIEADVDLFHLSDTSTDWTRWGPNKVRASDFVIVAISKAWAERWQGINAPACWGVARQLRRTLSKAFFGKDQSEFQRKTLIALLPKSCRKRCRPRRTSMPVRIGTAWLS